MIQRPRHDPTSNGWQFRTGIRDALLLVLFSMGAVDATVAYSQVLSGENYLSTSSALQYIEIPAGFFGVDTDAFAGEIAFRGESVVPGSNADTVLLRTDDITEGGTTNLELTAFRNVSVEPIAITGSGPGAGSYYVVASISPTVPAGGQLTVLTAGADGGTYQASLSLYPFFEFQPVGGGDPITLDTADPPIPGFPLWLASSGGSWTYSPRMGIYTSEWSSNFFFDGTIQIVRTDAGAGSYKCATKSATPTIAGIPTLSEWSALVMTLLLLAAGTLMFLRKRGCKTVAQ